MLMARRGSFTTRGSWLNALLVLLLPILAILLGIFIKPLVLQWSQVVPLVLIVVLCLVFSAVAFVFWSRVSDGVLSLNEMTDMLQAIRATVPPELFVVSDYAHYLHGREYASLWVMGVALEHTVSTEGTELLLQRLEEGCEYRFLCCGSCEDIEFRAKRIARAVFDANPDYLDRVAIRRVSSSHHVQLASTIYNAKHGCPMPTEVLIALTPEIETAVKPRAGVFLRGEAAVMQYLEKFEQLWGDTIHTERLSLGDLVAQAD
jgi:hypothetical protein